MSVMTMMEKEAALQHLWDTLEAKFGLGGISPLAVLEEDLELKKNLEMYQ